MEEAFREDRHTLLVREVTRRVPKDNQFNRKKGVIMVKLLESIDPKDFIPCIKTIKNNRRYSAKVPAQVLEEMLNRSRQVLLLDEHILSIDGIIAVDAKYFTIDKDTALWKL